MIFSAPRFVVVDDKAQYLNAILQVFQLELTRFRGHLTVGYGGVHDGRQDGPVHTGVQAADGGSG
jgi:hypothetical protein